MTARFEDTIRLLKPSETKFPVVRQSEVIILQDLKSGLFVPGLGCSPKMKILWSIRNYQIYGFISNTSGASNTTFLI
ncbi:hypothetical protein [Paenibacillus rhizophilus]|uniref:hypothetical protein n=1 Tax=Paenibacillus rhizophilus TaxID=1850366 RepID=UPI001FEAFBD9|nr:hypothetical protein [Paenibacillus rhizophilus]